MYPLLIGLVVVFLLLFFFHLAGITVLTISSGLESVVWPGGYKKKLCSTHLSMKFFPAHKC